MTPIQALVVDYGGVMIDAPTDDAHMQRVAAEFGLSGPELERGVFGERRALWDRLKLNKISEAAYRIDVQRNLNMPPEVIDTVLKRVFEDVIPHTEFIDYVRSLDGKLKLAILSNGVPVFTRVWQATGLLDWFDVAINSCEVNLAKPDPAIYKLVLRELALNADDCIFIDDQAKNLTTPANMGFRTVLYQDAQQAIAEIQALLA
jgi:putative hydrolase of the HAD superfamily